MNEETVGIERCADCAARYYPVDGMRRAGLTDDELRRVAQGPDAKGWDTFEAALLRAADDIHVDSFVSDATWKALSARYNTNQTIDLVDTVGTLTMHAGAPAFRRVSADRSQRKLRAPRISRRGRRGAEDAEVARVDPARLGDEACGVYPGALCDLRASAISA